MSPKVQKICIQVENMKKFLVISINLRILLGMIVLCMPMLLFSQTYSGIVLDEKDGKPLVGSYVTLVSQKGLLVSWEFSDERGRFKITIPENKQCEKIYFSFLGYKKMIVPLADFPSDGLIKMKKEDFQLEEVKVSAHRIIKKNDTLVYSVAGFSQPQDRSIADVIAKMPGMEVTADGQISFNGKNINKFYIEGMDLMNDRYSLASNNISKKRVKSVEVLQNHQPVELLRGKSFSEQAAINLVLEDDSKLNLVGTSDLGVGANKDDALYNNRLLAMLFGRKYQTLSIYKNDNTGYDLFSEISSLSLADLNKENVMETSMISLIATSVPDVDRTRYTFNKSHLIATNHLFQLAEKTNFRAQISYFDDVSEVRNSIETEYLFTDSLHQIMNENNSLNEKRNRLDTNLNFEVNRSNLYVKNDFKGILDWLSSRSSTDLNGYQRCLASEPDRLFLSNVLDVKLPLSSDRYISITSTNSYNGHPQNLTIYSNEIQRLNYDSFQTHSSASFRHKFFWMYATYCAGFQGTVQSLKSEITGIAAISKQRLEQYVPYGGIGFYYQNKSVNLSFDMKLRWKYWSYGKAKESSFCPEVRLYSKYNLSGTSTLGLTYQYSEQMQDLKKMYEGDLFTSYRTIVNNGQASEEDGVHRFSLRYQYSQPIKGMFFSLSTSVSNTKKHSAYSTSLFVYDNVLKRKKLSADYSAKMYLISARFSKSFNWWKSLLILSGSCMKTTDAQYNNCELQDYDMNNYMANVFYSARPLPFLSFEWESAWFQNNVNLNDVYSKVNRLKSRFNMNFPVGENFMFSLNNTVYQSLGINDSFWFIDFSARYTYKSMEFRVEANNLLNNSEYKRETVSSIQKNNYLYTLRPCDLICKVLFSF